MLHIILPIIELEVAADQALWDALFCFICVIHVGWCLRKVAVIMEGVIAKLRDSRANSLGPRLAIIGESLATLIVLVRCGIEDHIDEAIAFVNHMRLLVFVPLNII